MDYIGYKCPVCDKYFHIGEDIVVCPECGTPHHRECYASIGECANNSKHEDGYDFQNDGDAHIDDNGEALTICKKCGAKNSDSAFFCSKCGNTLIEQPNTHQQNNYGNYNQQNGSAPFPQGANVIMFDPLAATSPNADLGDSMTAGEAAKYVKQNTPYFITIFNNIKNFSKSRFNFTAMFFGGGYLLFRKMYKIGTIITAIQAAMTILYFYLNYYILSDNAYDKLFESASTYDTNATALYLSELSTQHQLILLVFLALSFMMLIMGFVIGACANRMYYMHCKKQINKIKDETTDASKISENIAKKGGVNIALALSLWITYIILSYLPAFFY